MSSLVFWGVAGTMTVAVCGLMIAGLNAGNRAHKAAQSDLQVYRDQLREVDRDLARGTISPDEAERLRIEIGRRVLAADRALHAPEAAQSAGPRRWVAAGLLSVILAGTAIGTYTYRGHPGLPDQPLLQRMATSEAMRKARPSQAQVETQLAARPATGEQPPADPRHAQLMDQLRAVTAERPDDLQGHALLARNEAMLGNFSAAAKAQAQVVKIKGAQATADDLAMQAELMITAAAQFVSPEAEEVLNRALHLDPQNGLARFYSGVMFAQLERYDLAFRFWAPLWESSSEDDPWTETLRNQLPDIAWLAGQMRYQLPPLKPAILRGPDAAAIASAQEMSPEERAQMIQGMVDGLMARLAAQGGTAPEWAQLIRALIVMGDTPRAQAIYDEAKNRFAGRVADLKVVNDAAAAAGLK